MVSNSEFMYTLADRETNFSELDWVGIFVNIQYKSTVLYKGIFYHFKNTRMSTKIF